MSKSDEMLRLMNIRNNIDKKSVYENVNEELVKQHLNSEANSKVFDEIQKSWEDLFNSDLSVELASEEEVLSLLKSLDDQFDKEKMEEFSDTALKDIMFKIVAPFGIGSYLAKFDKDGGNVDTVHNVRKDIYATDEERELYENRTAYDTHSVHSDKDYKDKNKELRFTKDLKDDYTGETLGTKINSKGVEKNDFDLDHRVSAYEVHEDKGRVLAGNSTNELANQDDNFSPTTANINRSKKADSMKNYLDSDRDSVKKLTDEQKKNMLEKDKIARKKIDEDINNKYYYSEKFRNSLLSTSVVEVGKMGVQQALGLFVTELVVETFYEVKEWLKTGLAKNSKFFNELLDRMKKVFERVANKWQDFWHALKDGAIAGFMSNMLTVIINCFVTTAKNIVRIIREGVMVIIKAINLLLFPPANMTKEQVYDSALKLISSGSISIIGIALTQALQASPFSTMPFADLIIGVIGALVTGILSVCALYSLNELDLFGVNAKEKHEFIMRQLTRDENEIKEERNDIINSFSLAF